jgi:serine/threonine-protein kinase
LIQLPQIPDCYTILAELGRGTTGVVYEAKDNRLDRRIALRIPLISSGAEGNVQVQRFYREFQVLAILTREPGSNIPTLLDVGGCEGHRYAVREFIDGSTLERRAREGTIELGAGLRIIAAVARIVHWVHGREFVHRNLSADNVLVTADGSVKLIGFGRVGLLAGSNLLQPGDTEVSPEVDVRGLQAMLEWLRPTLNEPLPLTVEQLQQSRSVGSAGAIADAIDDYLGKPCI